MSAKVSPAFLQLFTREHTRVVRLVQRIVGCPSIAEDLAQDAFLQIMHKPEQSPSYLFRTAQNLALDHLRAQKVRHRHAQGVLQEQAENRAPSAEDRAISGETLDKHLQALRALPERTQRVFLLNRLEGLSYAQIARQLDVSISTVEKDMIRALQACARRREPE